jgi:hypothetical protein
MYLGGWRPHSNVLIYKTFIRPTLEFGLALDLLPRPVLTALQQCQNVILRKLLACGRSTSLSAMHCLTHLAPIAFRNHFLHARYVRSLPVKTHSFVGLLHQQILTSPLSSSHLARSSRLNPLLSGPSPTDLSDSASVTPLRQTAILEVSGLHHKFAHLLRPLDARCHPVLRASFLDRELQRHFIHWMLGRYTQGSLCHQCRQPLTREHAVRCSGTWDRLSLAFPQPHPALLNPLDFGISQLRFRPREWYPISILSAALHDIRTLCLGHIPPVPPMVGHTPPP